MTCWPTAGSSCQCRPYVFQGGHVRTRAPTGSLGATARPSFAATGDNGPTSACPAASPSFVSYSTATGKPLQVLYKYQGQCVNGQALLQWINPSGSQAIGFILLDQVVNGKNTSVPNLFGVAAGGRFTQLPALPFHQDAVYNAGGIAF
jgi:hypothetical protein